MTQAPPVPPLHMQRDRFDPVPELAEVREGAGIRRVQSMFGAPAWLVARHEDVREVLADASRFSNAGGLAMRMPGDTRSEEEKRRAMAGQMLAADPPDHTRLRRFLTPEFTVRRMRRLEPRIVEIVDEHLDAMERAGSPADLVPSFALPIPSLVICELLGVPYADRDEFQHRTGRQLDLSIPMDERIALQRESRAYMDRLVAGAKADPGEDVLGMLVREHGDEMTDDELVGIASLLLVAGHETTSNMLGLGTLALLRHPDQLARVRDEPESVDAAVEELMRWLSIVHTGVARTATTEVEIAGQTIAAGELVLCALPTANRDPGFIDDPDVLDVSRGAMGHLAFGHGVHHCLGAPLARMEMRIAFPALLRRFPRLAAAVPFEEVPFRAFHFVYGLHSLHVTW
ncbi:cytochrome P450 [Pseudonocardia sp. KRD-184]|uniref:Cytochrome P450 n=1 Tax=Pseudonocardia oceani TaxID=2792013 RepID=A0ABS6UE28_9PSEU|nr:cytochrome P450 [Pseudonocardia oceani]MBW0093251.1 cytochrome P450 [Pseudonocardia oceani]MBW0100007.1 cytochrome P450 [Pseudonocardia oceani]MBW0112678.1 cytochrome P450 [Pseudonocardia oceani]MBW0121982.1 cytochrome P450 [Pseudonocardia oceani]MBW0130488.1 cytochrome P450 [Pseudonocardia oceani]